MGTSSIFNGPVKSLLPGDYVDNDDALKDPNSPELLDLDDSSPQVIPYKWSDAKGAMTRFVKGNSSDIGGVMSRYVGASGGSRQLSSSSTSGKVSTINLGRVIQGFRENGVDNTLHSLQIDFVGKTAKEVLSELVNIISGNADSKEDIAARGASSEAISELYKIVVDNDGDIESLRKIDESTFSKIIEVFMSGYIFGRVMSDLQSRFEQYENNPKEAVKKEIELKNYIKVKVEQRMREMKLESLDYRSNSIVREMDNLFKTCFKLFEDYV